MKIINSLFEPPSGFLNNILAYHCSHSDDTGKETESGSEKPAAPRPAATWSSSLEETKDPVKLQTNVGCSDNDENDENYIDSEDGEYIDDEVCVCVEPL